jgi:hypothetical protein
VEFLHRVFIAAPCLLFVSFVSGIADETGLRRLARP